jgi:hypothetical protein
MKYMQRTQKGTGKHQYCYRASLIFSSGSDKTKSEILRGER